MHWTIPNWNLLAHSEMKRHGKVFFQICVLIFFLTTYSQEDIEYIFHQFAHQLSLIELKFNSIES